MKSMGKYLSSALFGSLVLLGLTGVSASANTTNNNNVTPQGRQVTTTRTVAKSNQVTQPKVVNHFYNRRQKGAGRIYQTHYRFTKQLGKNSGRYAKHWYDQRINYNRVAKNQNGMFVKTRYGWLNKNAFNQFVITHGPLHYRMQVIHNGNLYNKPAKTNGAYKINSTRHLRLLHHWVNVDASADTNLIEGFYHFNYNNQGFWIPGQDLMFNLKALRGHNRRIERVISLGERMIGHSKYNENTRHYDCSSFVRHLFAHEGYYLGSTTYSQVDNGRRVNFRHMRRGDIFFFAAKGQGYLAHVGIYLGKGLFLHDSPSSDDGGVDVSSLYDKVWHCYNRYRTVYPNKIARRII